MRKLPLKRQSTLACLVMAGLLAACGNIPPVQPYQRPSLEMPASESAGSTAAPASRDINWHTWWAVFQDPALDALLREAAEQSQDLALASARIEESRAALDANQSNFFPAVDLNAAAARRRSSENSASANPSANSYSADFSVGLSASYEVDFWGKYANADKAARARLLGQTAARATVLATLYSNVAQGYFALRALDAQHSLAEQTLRTRADNLRLQTRRFEGGVTGELDFRQAEAEVAAASTSLQTTLQARRNAESALVTLLGRTPAAITQASVARGAEFARLYAAQTIPDGLPSDILNRRPDLIAAEQNLVAANADMAQARAAYFPRISLTANLGQQTKDLANLLEPASLFWNLVGNLAQPIFRAGALDAVSAAANARQKQAVAQYTLAVQNAFRDVRDALNNAQAGGEIALSISRRIEALRNTLRLASLRYNSGYSNYLEVLSAQRDLAQAEIALIDAQRTQLLAIVSFYRASGGGWERTAARAN